MPSSGKAQPKWRTHLAGGKALAIFLALRTFDSFGSLRVSIVRCDLRSRGRRTQIHEICTRRSAMGFTSFFWLRFTEVSTPAHFPLCAARILRLPVFGECDTIPWLAECCLRPTLVITTGLPFHPTSRAIAISEWACEERRISILP